MDQVGVGIIGSQFVSRIHAESLSNVPAARIAAVASMTASHVQAFARDFSVPGVYTDYHALLEDKNVDVVLIGIPNDLHAECVVDAAAAGKHVIVEKPFCMNLAEADHMISACRQAGVKLMYAEELCFAPKYVRAKTLVDERALGDIYLIKQSEKHSGPHSSWFWDVDRSGGGVLFDMGCHGVEFARWILNKRKVKSVYAQLGLNVHGARTRGDDNSILIIEFEGGATALIEDSWAKEGGMDDTAEIYGSAGVVYADILRGSSLITFSTRGYGYAVEKASSTVGWTFTMYEEAWNYGFPQEMAHFIDCIKNDRQAAETGEDGRAVLEIIFAGYESAATGRRIEFPYTPKFGSRPIEAWLRRNDQTTAN
ncbi:MAG TPA: Gfo/Idh/MocA family oxidoreductase [Blastocatellia bacterium]|nr:Gfo/Idh/MocA family oxidoreductase [Blastocatellia bacterium]